MNKKCKPFYKPTLIYHLSIICFKILHHGQRNIVNFGLSCKSGVGLPKLKKAFNPSQHRPAVVSWGSLQEIHNPEAATTNALNPYLSQTQDLQINLLNVRCGSLLLF